MKLVGCKVSYGDILPQGTKGGKPEGPFIPWLKPRGFLAPFL
jgi:hypothetical protein